jgi:pimeloyl-ACP methyl ester carboxylesterase
MDEFCFEERGLCYRTSRFDAGRQTLVFIHGLSSSASAWRLYEQRFESRYNVVTFDLRGHGKSAKPRGAASYTVAAMADDLFALITFLGIEPFVLIGHSFGTLVALEYLVEHQATVSKAVLLSPQFKGGSGVLDHLQRAVLGVTPILDVLPFSSGPAGHVDYAKYVNTGDRHLPRLLADISNTGWRVYLHCARQAYRFDREAALPDITIPVLLMHGRADSIFPMANSVHMAASIPRSELVLLDHAGHVVVLNNFPELSEAIQAFVERG